MNLVAKQNAIRMRRAGRTYSEILVEIPVAKSTLSEWLKSVGLSTPQKQRITQKRLAAAQRGADARRNARLEELEKHIVKGRDHVGKLSARELWLIGTCLYWAEGSKQRDTSLSSGVIFGNSDSEMIRVFMHWLRLMNIHNSAYWFELYVHESRKTDVPAFRMWWAKELNVPTNQISKVYFKRGNIKTNRTNIGDSYHGLIRIKVRASTILNRKINGWIYGIVASLGSGVTGNTPAFGAGDSRIVP